MARSEGPQDEHRAAVLKSNAPGGGSGGASGSQGTKGPLVHRVLKSVRCTVVCGTGRAAGCTGASPPLAEGLAEWAWLRRCSDDAQTCNSDVCGFRWRGYPEQGL